MGKSTISTGPFSIANCLFTRGETFDDFLIFESTHQNITCWTMPGLCTMAVDIPVEVIGEIQAAQPRAAEDKKPSAARPYPMAFPVGHPQTTQIARSSLRRSYWIPNWWQGQHPNGVCLTDEKVFDHAYSKTPRIKRFLLSVTEISPAGSDLLDPLWDLLSATSGSAGLQGLPWVEQSCFMLVNDVNEKTSVCNYTIHHLILQVRLKTRVAQISQNLSKAAKLWSFPCIPGSVSMWPAKMIETNKVSTK